MRRQSLVNYQTSKAAGPPAALGIALTKPSWQTTTTTVGPTRSASLNPSSSLLLSAMALKPEPSSPELRAELRLAPKSYAEAAEQGYSSSSPPLGNGHPMHPHETEDLNAGSPVVQLQPDSGHDTGSESGALNTHTDISSPKSDTSELNKEAPDSRYEVYEKHAESKHLPLVSTKPDGAFEGNQREDETPMQKPEAELVPGIKAGEGWHRSRYACLLPSPHFQSGPIVTVECP